MFKLMEKLSIREMKSILGNVKESKHYKEDRSYRLYAKSVSHVGIGALVDKGHKDGPEYHILLSDFSLAVVNAKSYKLCTVLYPRARQVARLTGKERLPQHLANALSRVNVYSGKNYMGEN